jgi:hypothetical protein
MKPRPWVWLALLFLASVVAWAVFIAIALRHAPKPAPGSEALSRGGKPGIEHANPNEAAPKGKP